AAAARCGRARPRHGRLDPRRAAQVPGRHRPSAGVRGDEAARRRARRAGREPAGVTALSGRLVDNIMQFARILRTAGLPVGPGQVSELRRAAEVVGIGNREDFYWALFATCVTRIEQNPLFDQAFHIFWRNPKLRERLMSMLLPKLESETAPPAGKPV